MTTHCMVVTGMAKAAVMAGNAILTAVSSGPTATPRLTITGESQRLLRGGTLPLVPAVALRMSYPARTSAVTPVASVLADHDDATSAIPMRQLRRGARHSST